MNTGHSCQPGSLLGRIAGRATALTVGLAFAVAGAACSTTPARPAPQRLTAPYETISGEVLWAVVPLRNESGTSAVDPLAVSDKLVAAAQEIEGVACLPVNRTILAMRALEMEAVDTPADAARLAGALGVDGLVLGSITAWDPYDPPVVGLSLGLYTREGAARAGLDAKALSSAATDAGVAPGTGSDAPVSTASLHLDARDSGVLSRVREYASGRSDPQTALGWRIYLMDMERFSSFAAHRGVGKLLEEEWVRLARAQSEDAASVPGSNGYRTGGGS